MDTRAIFETFFRRLYRERDPSVIAELRDDRARSEGLAREPLSNDAFARFHAKVMEVFREIEVKIDRLVEQDGHVALALRFIGTTHGGKRVEVGGAAFARIVDGRIAESQNLWDVASLAAQIGADNPLISPVLDEALGALRGR